MSARSGTRSQDPRRCRCGAHVATLALAGLLAGGCARERPSQELTWVAMGTFATLTCAGDNAAAIGRSADAVKAVYADLERTLSIYNPQSEISRLNAAAGREPVPLSPPAVRVLREALAYARLSGGAFDVTVAPLIQFWGFSGGTPPAAWPSPAAVDEVARRTGYAQLAITNGAAAGFLCREGMKVDLGGIAKGFAVDEAWEALRRAGVRDALVNLGGNMRCAGRSPRGTAWSIGVRDPFDSRAILGSLVLPDGMAVASSGNYEKFVMIGDRRCTHIIDPRSGYPVDGMAGTTVLTPTATQADAMSTATFVLGVEGAPALLRQVPECEALLVPARTPVEIWLTPGFAKAFTPRPNLAASLHTLLR
jgi:FAD:protein FMN transferase